MAEVSDWKAAFRKELEQLQQSRDELKVQVHLAASELKQEWQKLEATFQHVQDELAYTGEQSKQPARDLSKAARELLDELKRGYERVRTGLRQA